jgi:hypothetical protein
MSYQWNASGLKSSTNARIQSTCFKAFNVQELAAKFARIAYITTLFVIAILVSHIGLPLL